MSWHPMKSVPKDRPVLILLEECSGTYPVLARYKRDQRGFVWCVCGADNHGGWHEKCALGWAPVKLPRVPARRRSAA